MDELLFLIWKSQCRPYESYISVQISMFFIRVTSSIRDLIGNLNPLFSCLSMNPRDIELPSNFSYYPISKRFSINEQTLFAFYDDFNFSIFFVEKLRSRLTMKPNNQSINQSEEKEVTQGGNHGFGIFGISNPEQNFLDFFGICGFVIFSWIFWNFLDSFGLFWIFENCSHFLVGRRWYRFLPTLWHK